MKKTTYILLYVFAIVLTACTKVIVAQPTDTLYSEKMVMSIYGRQPERALQIIDSAEILGNITDVRADYLRALVYSKAVGSLQFDTAILISERLMQNDEVLADAGQKQEVLEVLLNACRLRKDYEQALHWATQLSDLYRENGKETEALRTDAEICIEKGIYDQAITAAEHMLDLLSDFEKHPDNYHDSSIREPSEASRPNYISFYRGKAYGYLAAAYTNTGNQNKARYYLSLYDNTSSGQSLTGRFMMTPTLEKLGEYNRVLAIYDEVERKLDNDTLNDNFARILKSRARIGEAQGQHAEANGYWRRYISITENLNEELLQGKAHLYAARFHAQEQQREIERQRDAAHRAEASRRVIVSISILIFLFAIYVWRQWRKTKKQNKILAQQITEVSEYKKRYRELKPVQPMEPLTDSPAELSDADLYVYLRDLIEHEQLFLNPLFERQTLIERTGLTKERIGAAFSQGSDHGRLTTLISDLRLDYAVRLMNEQPELSVERICQASGFANADTFTRNFKAKDGTQTVSDVKLMGKMNNTGTYCQEVEPDGLGGAYVYINQGDMSLDQPFNVRVFHYDADGNSTISDTLGVTVHSTDLAHVYVDPSVSVDPVSHDLLVTYVQESSAQYEYKVFVNRITSTGERVWDEGVMVFYNDGNPISKPFIAAFEDGSGFAVTYFKGVDILDPNTTIEAIGMDMNCNVLWQTVLSSSLYMREYPESISGFHNGQCIIVWANDEDKGNVYAQNFGVDGSMGQGLDVEEIFEDEEIVTIVKIFNVNGQVMQCNDLNELNTGVYIIQGETESGKIVNKKVVLTKK